MAAINKINYGSKGKASIGTLVGLAAVASCRYIIRHLKKGSLLIAQTKVQGIKSDDYLDELNRKGLDEFSDLGNLKKIEHQRKVNVQYYSGKRKSESR